MDDDGDHPYTWLTRRVPRGVVLVVATIGLGVASFAVWENVNGRGLSPIVIVFFALFVALGIGYRAKPVHDVDDV